MNVADTVVSAILGAAATIAIQALFAWLVYLRESRVGEFTGDWYAILPASGGKTERRELMHVRQRRQVLRVRIERYFPPEESGRKWKMLAYLHGNILIGVFHTTAPKNDPSSYGAIVLHRDSLVKDCSVWRGYYARPDSNSLQEIISGNVERHPIVWQHISPERHSYWQPPSVAQPGAAPNP